jgi:SNF2 family DNA or RNA helicase
VLDNWNEIKIFDRKELTKLVPKGFKFKTKPWTHQLAAFIACTCNEGFLSALDLGTGKTKVAIDTCRYYLSDKKDPKILFVCLTTAVGKMVDEVHTHSDFKAIGLTGPKDKKWEDINKKSNFYIIGYEGLRYMVSVRKNFGRKPGAKRDTKKDVIDSRLINKLKRFGFDAIIIDESHVIKTSKSLIFRVIKSLSSQIKIRMLLTGTPFGNTLIDVWSQYYIIDKGETFGPNFTRFRNAYFQDTGYFGPVWEVTDTGKKFIKSNLYKKSIRYEEAECTDLPPKKFDVLPFSLSREQKYAYNSLVNGNMHHLTSEIKSKVHGYRQIASGFIKDPKYIFKKNPKLDLLWESIEPIIDRHKIVIFVEYTISRKIISDLLKKKKVIFRSLSGETKDKYAEYMSFQNDPKVRIIICQSKSGSASIDLFAGTYCFFYEHGGSVINYKQAVKRIHRGGQTKRCFFYSLIGRGTVEVGIHKDLIDGVDAFSRIVDGDHAKRYILGDEVT